MQSSIESSAAEVIPSLKGLPVHLSIFHSSFLNLVTLMVFFTLGQETSAKEAKENMILTETIDIPRTNSPVIDEPWLGQLPCKTQPNCHKQRNSSVAGHLT